MASAYSDRDAAAQRALLEQHLLNNRQPDNEPSIAELLNNLISDAQILVRKEFALARQEVTQEIDKARQVAIMMGIGAAVLAVGAILFLVAIVHALVAWFDLPLWASYLIVGGVFAIVGGIMVAMGKEKLKEVHPIPEETIDSVRKDISWLKEQNPSDRT